MKNTDAQYVAGRVGITIIKEKLRNQGSFHVLKNITTGGEGGAVVWRDFDGVDNDELELTLRLLGDHGQTSRDKSNGWEYDIALLGYNDTKDYWKFSLYNSQSEPIVLGIKIVPRFPLNVFCGVAKLPDGVFGAMTKLDRIGKDDFHNGKAQFIFCPVEI